MKLNLTNNFKKNIRKKAENNPVLKEKLLQTLRILENNPNDIRLHSHKLKGDLRECWSCSIDFNNRIIYKIIFNNMIGENEILLLSFGSHDEVY